MATLCIDRGFDKIMIKVFGSLGFILVMEETGRGREFHTFGSLSKRSKVSYSEARQILEGMEERIRNEHARALEDDLRILSKVRDTLNDRLGPPKS